jgi:hypothetical protein
MFIFILNLIFAHSFDFCKVDEDNSPVENLGQVVFGERIRPSPYQVRGQELVSRNSAV